MPVINRHLTRQASFVRVPGITTPSEGGYILPTTLRIESTPFATEGLPDTMLGVTVQVATDRECTNVVYEQRIETTSPVVEIAMPAQTQGAVRYFRMRHEGKLLGNSEYSTARMVRVTAAQAPAILSPANGATGVAIRPALQLSPWTDTGGLDTGTTTRVQVSKAKDFSSIIWDSGKVTYRTSIQIEADLKFGETHFCRSMHTGAILGETPWSESIQVEVSTGSFVALFGKSTNSVGQFDPRKLIWMGDYWALMGYTQIKEGDSTAARVGIASLAVDGESASISNLRVSTIDIPFSPVYQNAKGAISFLVPIDANTAFFIGEASYNTNSLGQSVRAFFSGRYSISKTSVGGIISASCFSAISNLTISAGFVSGKKLKNGNIAVGGAGGTNYGQQILLFNSSGSFLGGGGSYVGSEKSPAGMSDFAIKSEEPGSYDIVSTGTASYYEAPNTKYAATIHLWNSRDGRCQGILYVKPSSGTLRFERVEYAFGDYFIFTGSYIPAAGRASTVVGCVRSYGGLSITDLRCINTADDRESYGGTIVGVTKDGLIRVQLQTGYGCLSLLDIHVSAAGAITVKNGYTVGKINSSPTISNGVGGAARPLSDGRIICACGSSVPDTNFGIHISPPKEYYAQFPAPAGWSCSPWYPKVTSLSYSISSPSYSGRVLALSNTVSTNAGNVGNFSFSTKLIYPY